MSKSRARLPRLTAAVMVAALALPVAARADDSATVRLIQLLIQKGVLTQDQADSLLKQAQAESRAAKPKPAKAAKVAKAAQAASAPLDAEPPPPPPPEPQVAPVAPGTVRVTYVPQIVRDQIAAEVQQQVMQKAQSEGWAAPGESPEWTKRIHIYGDIRARGQEILEDHGNGAITNFNAINSGSPFDINGGTLPPSLNTTENRFNPVLRARLGVQADINDWATSNIRFGTGNDSSPVSTNQFLGATGNFSKYAAWLDQAYLTLKPFQSFKMVLGREPNPFWTSDLDYYDELNFDGAAVNYSYPVNGMLDVFANAGAFSIYNTALAFSTYNLSKFPSHDKYLFAGQAGVDLKPLESVTTKLAAGFFAYTNIDGKLSAPCTIVQSNIGCDTDATAAQFIQNGNSLFPIRNIATTATNGSTPEYYGLASRFGVLDLHGQVGYSGFRAPITVEGDFSKNLEFNRALVASRGPVNNLSPNSNAFQGGDTAYLMKLTVGKLQVSEKWDWNTFIAYKYLESDAVLDALNDPNFHLGGTNAKGFIVGANLGLAHNLALSAIWYSASQIDGAPYANDLVQVDLSARF